MVNCFENITLFCLKAAMNS